MQRFTLLHDGSTQGWHAIYLALHITARLGAPLQVLHIRSDKETKTLTDTATHVETGAHAAEVDIETRLLADFKMETLKQNITSIDGLFLPLRLLSDGDTASRFLEAFSCPLWVASTDSQPTDIAVLLNDPLEDTNLISFAKTLSTRLEQPLVAFVRDDHFEATLQPELSGMKWRSLQEFSAPRINEALEQLHIGLFIIPVTNTALFKDLNCNFVIHIHPAATDA